MGWACPHARVPYEEELVCALGWSPTGIEYGPPGGAPVSVIAMYLVPANQRNHYLREIALLAKALSAYSDAEKLRSAANLNDVRNYLLDLIGSTKDTVGPDARARMIQLQAKPSMQALAAPDLSNLIVEPLTVVAGPGLKPVVLTQRPGLGEMLDGATGLVEKLESDGAYQDGGWRVVKRGILTYQGGRVLYDCLAIRVRGGSAPPPR